jgi:hypothetical protein
MSKESMIATILTTKCRERRNLGIIQPDKNPDIVSGSDQELRTMPTSTEHKTVQARVLAYAEAEGALLGRFRHLHTNIYGNRRFLFSPIVLH